MRGRRLVIIFLWLLGGSAVAVQAQSDLQLSQHMFNRLNYNPAVTGASRYVNISAYMRQQWTGWEGAPRSQMFTVHSYFEKIKSGMGLIIVHDAIGLERSVNTKVAYAYHVRLSSRSYLSFGLSGGVLYRFFDRGAILSEDDMFHQQEFPLKLENKCYPDFDFGVEFNSSDLTLGFSVTHLVREENSPLVAGRHFYGFARYVVPLSETWNVEPSLFFQATGNFVHSEINLTAFYRRSFWLGSSYRVDRDVKGESFVLLAGARITDNIRIGYSYDLNFGSLQNYTKGAHEILLIFRFRRNQHGHTKSPCFLE